MYKDLWLIDILSRCRVWLDPSDGWRTPSKKHWVAGEIDQTKFSFLPWFIRAGGECHVESERRAMRQGDLWVKRRHSWGKSVFYVRSWDWERLAYRDENHPLKLEVELFPNPHKKNCSKEHEPPPNTQREFFSLALVVITFVHLISPQLRIFKIQAYVHADHYT